MHLADGLVMDHINECPGHNGQFDCRTGEPALSPVCEALKTYPIKVEDGIILINFDNSKDIFMLSRSKLLASLLIRRRFAVSKRLNEFPLDCRK